MHNQILIKVIHMTCPFEIKFIFPIFDFIHFPEFSIYILCDLTLMV